MSVQMKEVTVTVPVQAHTYRKIDLVKAVEMRLRGLTQDEIAATMGVNRSAISQALAPYAAEIGGVEVFKNNRANIFSYKQYELINALTPDKIKKMTGDRLVLAMCQLYDKERLETGKSTINQSIMTSIIESASKEHESKDDTLDTLVVGSPVDDVTETKVFDNS